MKRVPLILLLAVQGSALAQRPVARIPLKEAIVDFPRSQLQLKTNGPVSIDVSQGALAAYETLAGMAGLNILVDPDFRDSSIAPFRIENAGILEAFDLLSSRMGTFVEVLNSNTIIVSPDNQTKRRDYELHVLKTFYLPNGTTRQQLTEIITALRTTLLARYIAQSTTANAIIMRETPNQVALAEKTIAASTRIVGGVPAATQGESIRGSHVFTLEAGAVHDSTPGRSALRPTSTGPVSFDMKEISRVTFETVARSAGLNVVFDRDFRSPDTQPFKVENVSIVDALDFLALRTRTFWEVLDSKTIMVTPDNQTKRRDFENVLVKTFYLPNASQVELTEIVTALRALLNCRFLAIVSAANAIVVRDTPNRLALAERVVTDLRKSATVATAAGIPSGSEGSFILSRRAARTSAAVAPSLQSRVRGPFSFDTNDSVRASYEAMAAMAGLRVVFDDRFLDAAAVPLKLQGVDILDALDFLSLQTGNIWQVMDNYTIVVAPDNQTVRGDLLPRSTKTINLTRLQRQDITEVITALRTILNLRQVAALENSIIVQDTPENIAFAERMLSDLERPGAR